MVFNNRYRYQNRSGAKYRAHPDRYTYIKGAGWFVYLRGDQETLDGIKVDSGIAGPFHSRADAMTYLTKIINKSHPGLNFHEQPSFS